MVNDNVTTDDSGGGVFYVCHRRRRQRAPAAAFTGDKQLDKRVAELLARLDILVVEYIQLFQ